MKRLYVCGPMRNRPEFNFPAFDAAANTLRAAGYDPVNPADHDRENGFDATGMTGNENLSALGFSLRDALTWDLEQVANVDGVAVLPGWEKSKGAKAEVALAEALGTPVLRVGQWVSQRDLHTEPAGAVPQTGEVRTVSATGGEKGTKPERYDLIPVEALATVARLYGRGAEKYAANNWRRGYEWSKSYAAMQRHINQFWGGEDIDPEMQLPHLASVVFHALALLTFMEEQPDFDDRYSAMPAKPAGGKLPPSEDGKSWFEKITTPHPYYKPVPAVPWPSQPPGWAPNQIYCNAAAAKIPDPLGKP